MAPIGSLPTTSDRVDEVRLGLPAQPGYAQVARLTVTAVAARIGFSYDEIEDLRIAVGELCSLLVVNDPAARMSLRVTASDTEVVIEADRQPAAPAIEVDDLSDQILRAVVDEVDLDLATARVSVCKRRQA